MDEALNNGAQGISIFTVGSLRSPELRAKFKSYADSARASRSASKGTPETPVSRSVNTNPFEKTGIMNAANLNMLAYLSLVKACALPELKKTDMATIQLVSRSAMQAKTAEDYINRLSNAPRRNKELQPVAKAIADQFMKDNQAALNLGEYKLVNEYGATRVYQVTEQNSKVVFDVTFYFYGGIISGWSVSPEEVSYNKYKKNVGA